MMTIIVVVVIRFFSLKSVIFCSPFPLVIVFT